LLRQEDSGSQKRQWEPGGRFDRQDARLYTIDAEWEC
jgi:hypothetical protein